MSKRIRTRSNPRFLGHLTGTVVLATAWLASAQFAFTQSSEEFHRSLAVTASEPVTIEVEALGADVQILYSHEGQVSIAGFAHSSADLKWRDEFFKSVLTIEQNGNRIVI